LEVVNFPVMKKKRKKDKKKAKDQVEDEAVEEAMEGKKKRKKAKKKQSKTRTPCKPRWQHSAAVGGVCVCVCVVRVRSSISFLPVLGWLRNIYFVEISEIWGGKVKKVILKNDEQHVGA